MKKKIVGFVLALIAVLNYSTALAQTPPPCSAGTLVRNNFASCPVTVLVQFYNNYIPANPPSPASMSSCLQISYTIPPGSTQLIPCAAACGGSHCDVSVTITQIGAGPPFLSPPKVVMNMGPTSATYGAMGCGIGMLYWDPVANEFVIK